MAGFDFTFRCKRDCILLGRNLLRRAQRLAKNFDLELKYKSTSNGWYVTVDGPLPSMQVLIQPLVVQLFPFAEGFPNPKDIHRRRRTVKRFINEYIKGLKGITELVEYVADSLGGAPNSYFFNEGTATHLSSLVREFEQSLILFHNGWLSASQFVEEAHTMTEALLKACLPKNKRRGSFAKLLEEVANITALDPSYQEVLIRLKERRKMAKHHGQRVKREDILSDINELISALHYLFGYLRKSRI